MSKYVVVLPAMTLPLSGSAQTPPPSTKVSKSQLKRNAQALRALGVQLMSLKASALAKMPLDETLRNAILLAQSLQRSALRRQLNYIAKLLRAMQALEIQPLQLSLAPQRRQRGH